VAEVAIEAVSKRFGRTEAVRDLSLTIREGEFVVLLGPTGAGKTTTLRLIAGLEEPDAGRLVIGGRDVRGVPPASRDVAFVFQQYSLYPHLTVAENLAFPLRSPARKWSEAEIKSRVAEVAKLVRIDHKLDNKATRLSGGEMQRVAIGRALVRKPAIYLMDEPLSSLDAKLRGDLRLELKRIQAELFSTMLYVTHDDGRPHRHPRRRPAGADRHAQRDIHGAGEPACRRSARPAGDQPASSRPAAGSRGACRNKNNRRAHGTSDHPQGSKRPRRRNG
jgi:multiple sugar transport system ATP-binding protein